MKLIMLKTVEGSPDGITSRAYVTGSTEDVPTELADVFVREGWAKPAEDAPADPAKPKKNGRQTKTKAPEETKVTAPEAPAGDTAEPAAGEPGEPEGD